MYSTWCTLTVNTSDVSGLRRTCTFVQTITVQVDFLIIADKLTHHTFKHLSTVDIEWSIISNFSFLIVYYNNFSCFVGSRMRFILVLLYLHLYCYKS